jgi:hypothetical protein
MRAALGRHHWPILSRSRHLPVGVVDGSLTENLNKTGVRLWTDPSLDQNRKIGGRHALDPIANHSNRAARSDQRRRTIAATARARQRPTAVRALDLHKRNTCNHGVRCCRSAGRRVR